MNHHSFSRKFVVFLLATGCILAIASVSASLAPGIWPTASAARSVVGHAYSMTASLGSPQHTTRDPSTTLADRVPPTSTQHATLTDHEIPLYEPARYGTIYLYPFTQSEWDAEDYGAMLASLNGAKALGLDTIIQLFPVTLVGSGNEGHWLYFLDAAEEVGIDIIAYLWPGTIYTAPDAPFDYDDLKDFLDVVDGHPALVGYIGLHEPLEQPKSISDDELRAFYTEMKSYAPDLAIVHYMADIAYAEENRTDGWLFSDGMCDSCIIWYYPFRYIGGNPVYEQDLVPPVVQSNLALVHARDPDAEVWFLGQAFSNSTHPRNLRMPTADEMEALYLLTMQCAHDRRPVEGFFWYPWNHTEAMADASLGDEGMEEQQGEVKDIVDAHTGFARLGIHKSVLADKSPLYPGDTITYTLQFTNYGPHAASHVQIVDLVPGELCSPAVIGSNGPAITPSDGITFSWAVAPLQPAEGGAITLTAVISPGLEVPGESRTRIITNTAQITAPIAPNSTTLISTVTIRISITHSSEIYLPLVAKDLR